MKQTGTRIRIRISPAAATLVLGLLLTDRSLLCLATLLAAGFHEAGHLCAARLLHIPLRALRLDLMGARLDITGRMLSYGEEWLLCAAGPLFSLLLAAAPAPVWAISQFARQLSAVSLLLGLLNLLPIRSFDGGRMLAALLAVTVGERAAGGVLTGCSFVFLFLLWCLAVYFLLRAGDGLSLLCFSMNLLARFFYSSGSP